MKLDEHGTDRGMALRFGFVCAKGKKMSERLSGSGKRVGGWRAEGAGLRVSVSERRRERGEENWGESGGR